MTNQFLKTFFLSATTLMAVLVTAQASAGVPIKINAWGIHFGGQIVYRYQIENKSASIIYKADLGLNSPGKELPGKPWSLNPAYSDIPVPLVAAFCKPFIGMNCTISVFQFDYMIEPKSNISMEGIENSIVPPPKVFSDAEDIRPGTLSSIAELTIPPAYQTPGYLTAYGKVFLIDSNTKNPDGTIVTSVEIQFTKVDMISPVLSVTLSPSTIWPPNDKLVPITATITVKDDYDPQPEIKLESITSSEGLATGDIQGAQIGTDDRQFSLVAKRAGTNLAGRVYTITYSATDGSGNKSIASATVTVPHDKR